MLSASQSSYPRRKHTFKKDSSFSSISYSGSASMFSQEVSKTHLTSTEELIHGKDGAFGHRSHPGSHPDPHRTPPDHIGPHSPGSL